METAPTPPEEPDDFMQLALFGLQKVMQRQFTTPSVTEITAELPFHSHRVSKDDFIEGL